MSYDGFKLFKVRVDKGVAFVTIDNPPMNLLNMQMIMEFGMLATTVRNDDNVRVIVFDSADPDFFIAHFDVQGLVVMPDEAAPKKTSIEGTVHSINEAYRTMPKISIAKVEGVVRGGGFEFIQSFDMIFGEKGKAIFAQPEIGVGIIPGGGGTIRIPREVGRRRAMEIVVGGHDFPAETAELYGLINRALPPDKLTLYVENLAYRIAGFPAESIATAKQSVLAGVDLPLETALLEEQYLFGQAVALPTSKARMKMFLSLEGQSRELEANINTLLDEQEENPFAIFEEKEE
ncbi:MAG: enoyl-CoA hydratase/isomerase family protein [Candidatus Lokiarchaeota archaeon]|nr:enoyl-CoA hydratase/isomerase family protein [Candidatus Lokiarchaeota archaeon]